MTNFLRNVTRIKGNRFMDLCIGVENRFVGGSPEAVPTLILQVKPGSAQTKEEAKKSAYDRMVRYYELNPLEIIVLNKREGAKCHDEASAATFMQEKYGDLFGLLAREQNGSVLFHDLDVANYISFAKVPEASKMFPGLVRFIPLIGKEVNEAQRKRILKAANNLLAREAKKKPHVVGDPEVAPVPVEA